MSSTPSKIGFQTIGGSEGIKLCMAHFIELLLPNSLVLVSSKNSQVLFEKIDETRRQKYNFRPKNDVFFYIIM